MKFQNHTTVFERIQNRATEFERFGKISIYIEREITFCHFMTQIIMKTLKSNIKQQKRVKKCEKEFRSWRDSNS